MRDDLPVNRLAQESSLYLQQHSRNPVDWFPWGDEAIERARELERPIFLSIGYSACHWCHVMEHECFENDGIAAILNENFVSIKVDREERPDIDQIYMNALQVMSREGGGWPLSVFLTPELQPFYAGTYFPPDNRYAPQRPGFPQLLRAVINAWTTQRDQLIHQASEVTSHLQQLEPVTSPQSELTVERLKPVGNQLRRVFDPANGGFGHQPKFPHAIEQRLLMRCAKRFDDPSCMEMARITLEKMALGGIYDHLGGGFHRYSVDAHWLVPHFEKMLYDNALLTSAYVEAYLCTKDVFFRHVAVETIEYIRREMTSPVGAFYSTQDADSEGEEGKFYVWSKSEITQILGESLAKTFNAVYDVTDKGNFEGHNILNRSTIDSPDLSDAKRKLLEVRSHRIWPGRDEKILTSWNGLMIAALAQAGMAFDRSDYTEMASKAADFILTNMRTSDGRLHRTCAVGIPAKLNGYLEDYSFFIDALIELYFATFDVRWLRSANELTEVMIAEFGDPNSPGFFYTGNAHEPLIARNKDWQEGSIPSGNSMAVSVLQRLGVLVDKREYVVKANETLQTFLAMIQGSPMAAGQMLCDLDFHVGPVQEWVVIGSKSDPETLEVLHAIRTTYHPNKVVVLHDPASGDAPTELVPLLKDKPMQARVTTYLCQNYACLAPMIGVEAVRLALQ